MKDTNFGILLFFERLDDVRSFPNKKQQVAVVLQLLDGADSTTDSSTSTECRYCGITLYIHFFFNFFAACFRSLT